LKIQVSVGHPYYRLRTSRRCCAEGSWNTPHEEVTGFAKSRHNSPLS
jgi:hypothetical protein